MAIGFGLPGAEQIEIRAVEHENRCRHYASDRLGTPSRGKLAARAL
jgi:hypothetical protein